MFRQGDRLARILTDHQSDILTIFEMEISLRTRLEGTTGLVRHLHMGFTSAHFSVPPLAPLLFSAPSITRAARSQRLSPFLNCTSCDASWPLAMRSSVAFFMS